MSDATVTQGTDNGVAPETPDEEYARLSSKRRRTPKETERLEALERARWVTEQERRDSEKAREAVEVAMDREDHLVAHLLTSVGDQTAAIARQLRDTADEMDRGAKRAVAALDAGENGWRQFIEQIEWALSSAVRIDAGFRAIRAMSTCAELLQTVGEKRRERAAQVQPAPEQA